MLWLNIIENIQQNLGKTLQILQNVGKHIFILEILKKLEEKRLSAVSSSSSGSSVSVSGFVYLTFLPWLKIVCYGVPTKL